MAGEAIGQGAILEVQTAAGPPIVYTQVGGVADQLPTPGVSRSPVDVTAMDSTWREYIAGIPDPRSRTFTVVARKGTTAPNWEAGQQAMEALAVSGATVSFRFTMPPALGSIKITCLGFVTEWEVTAANGERVEASCTIQFSGQWSKAA